MVDPKSKLKKIVKSVLIGHLLLLLFLMINFKPSRKKVLYAKKVLRENVRIIEKPKPKKVVAKAKKTAPKKTPQKIPAKAIAKTTSKKSLPKLKKLPEAPAEIPAPLILPKAIAKLDVEEVEDGDVEEEAVPRGRYFENLRALILQEIMLKLGSHVAIELTLNKRGEVIHVKHRHSSDTLSRDYVIEKIKEIEFPNFFGEIARESEYTYVLTLNQNLL